VELDDSSTTTVDDAQLQINLHEAQVDIFNSEARFRVVAAGRRFGKSYLAAYLLLVEGLKDQHIGLSGNSYNLALKEVYYVAPTFEQARKIMWPLIKELGREIITTTHENTATCTLINGRRISIKGADRPDSLRGIGLSFVVLDEYAFMKEGVWDAILRPALSDVEGRALFIGTPEGENHFFDTYMMAMKQGLPQWEAWSFKSIDNPTLAKEEIAAAKDQLSEQLFAQEYEASFSAESGTIFQAGWWKKDEQEPSDGEYYIACDLAGFTNVGSLKKKELKIRDESAIAIVKVSRDGWYVKEIVHGQWDVRETALRIMKAYRDYRPVRLGIEKGMAKNAVMPYLEDEMKRLDVYFTPFELTHGNERKLDRIRWALQGRAEKGRITLNISDEWTRRLIKQAADFPSSLAHDDLLDALAYIDQLASVVYFNDMIVQEDPAYDDLIGF
jgi:predicted phage terminase large subunit-like protein